MNHLVVDKHEFRVRCATAHYDTVDAGWTSRYRTPAAITEAIDHWYRQRLAWSDFDKIVKIARDALAHCDQLNDTEQVRALVQAEITFNPSMVVNVLLHDIAPLRELLLTEPMNIDDYKLALQLIIDSFTEDD